MEPGFTVFAHVSRPSHAVFEAVADPAKLSAYFTTGGAEGWLEAGSTVSWDFHDFPGRFPVDVVEVVPDRRIVLKWDAGEGSDQPGYKTTVTMEFTPLDGDTRTRVDITEEGWRENAAALGSSYGNCMGWSQMLAALKVWVEHGINLREGLYK